MIIVTTDWIEGRKIVSTLGLVKGSSIRTRNVGRDIVAQLRNLVGGEVPEYTKMMAQSREQAVQRMVKDAETQGADAIVGARFATSMIMSGAAEMLAYGTAVKLE